MTSTHRRATHAALIFAILVVPACGTEDGAGPAARPPATTVALASIATPATMAAPADSERPATTAAAGTTGVPSPATTGSDWRREATAVCDHFINGGLAVPEPDGTPESATAFLGAHRQI